MPRPTLRRLAVLAVAAAAAVASCSGSGGSVEEPPTTTMPSPAGMEYEVPAPHPSDWDAPEVELPETPRPYGASPGAPADPGFYDVSTLFYEDYAAEGRRLLDQGFVVTATDYHGLGTPGVHGYHVSDELALATVDSVAATHRFEEVGPLSPSWVVVGHSEGGLAALAVDQRGDEVLQGLDYRGAVVTAPSAQLGSVAALMFDFPEGRGYGALLLEATAELDPRLDPAVALQPVAAALLTHGCWEEAVPGFDDLDADAMLANPDVGELLGEVLDACCASNPDAAVGPLLVVHGEGDESLPPELTSELVRRFCAAGVAVEHRTYPGAGHDEVMAASADDARRWIANRLAGGAPPSSCATLTRLLRYDDHRHEETSWHLTAMLTMPRADTRDLRPRGGPAPRSVRQV